MMEGTEAPAQRSWGPVSQHNLDAPEEVYAADLVWHEPDQDVRGVEDATRYDSTYLSTLPDLDSTVEDVINEEDKVVTPWTVRTMKSRAVNILAALALCGLAVTLVLLLAPDISWAAVLKWLTTSSSGPCPFLR